MPVRQSHPEDLEPIERASRDELTALQLQRLQWTLSHAYRNVPHYAAAFDAANTNATLMQSGADDRGGMPCRVPNLRGTLA